MDDSDFQKKVLHCFAVIHQDFKQEREERKRSHAQAFAILESINERLRELLETPESVAKRICIENKTVGTLKSFFFLFPFFFFFALNTSTKTKTKKQTTAS